MKKLLLSLIAILCLFTACKQDDPVYPTTDTYNYTVERSIEPVTGYNITKVNFSSTAELNPTMITFNNPSEFVSSSITFSGKTAVLTTRSTLIRSYLITYTNTGGVYKDIFGFVIY